MLISLCFTAFGYLCGSILFARVYGALFGKDLISNSTDGNPGTSNAFIYGGMLCGTLTLLGDLIKGFLPVFLYLYMTRGNMDIYLAPVLVSPVLGHILPLLLPLSRRQGHSRFVRLPFGAFARSPAAFDPCGNLYFALGSGAHIPALLQNNCNLLPFYRNLRPFCGFRGGHARVCAYFAVNYIPPLKKPRGKTKI